MLVEEAVAVVCLQAQRVTGLPAAVQQIQLGCHHLGRQPEPEEPPVRARACVSRGQGVADFHNEVLLLHCGAAVTSVLITVSVSSSSYHLHQQQHLGVDLGQRQPGTHVLSFVLSGAAAGAVLTLALHHRLVRPRTSSNSCLPLPACCRRINTNKRRRRQQQQGYDSDESAGFITIEKQPPSDNLLTTDDEDADSTMKLELDVDSSSRVEDEFLAMLETDTDLDLDMLIKDAEAELASAPWRSKADHLFNQQNAAAAASMM